MSLRTLKIMSVGAMGLLLSLIAFGNLTDYDSNFQFVRHVLAMDTLFPDATIRYRAITASWAHHLAFGAIITTQILAAVLCWLGTSSMWRHRESSVASFQHAKRVAFAGLALGAGLYLIGFITIGGEWFGMWMSQQWNGVEGAFRFFLMFFAALIFVGMHDDDADTLRP
jgi:predicted small integral membrane protein